MVLCKSAKRNREILLECVRVLRCEAAVELNSLTCGGQSFLVPDLSRHIDIFQDIKLPYFPNLSLTEAQKVGANEADTFRQYYSLLKTRSGDLALADKPNIVKELTQELAEGSQVVIDKANKMSAKGLLSNAGVGSFNVSLGCIHTKSDKAAVVVAQPGLAAAVESLSQRPNDAMLEHRDLYIAFGT
jgi:hypothetical protein